MSEIIGSLKEVLAMPGVLKEIYSDSAKQGVQQVGKALDGILGLGNTILYPLHLLNGKASIALKANLEKYRKKMEEVPEEDVNSVPPEIGVPIAEKLVYVTNEELADMYISLLAKASSKINTDQAHPGFVDIINRLSPDEAALLQKFKLKEYFPFIELRFHYIKSNTFNVMKDLATDQSFYIGLQQPNNVPAYLSNLNALGIIDIRRDTWCEPRTQLYPPLEQNHGSDFKDYPQIKSGIAIIKYINGSLDLTPIGKLFIQACFSPLKKSPKKNKA